jgi:hypothetical protein
LLSVILACCTFHFPYLPRTYVCLGQGMRAALSLANCDAGSVVSHPGQRHATQKWWSVQQADTLAVNRMKTSLCIITWLTPDSVSKQAVLFRNDRGKDPWFQAKSLLSTLNGVFWALI